LTVYALRFCRNSVIAGVSPKGPGKPGRAEASRQIAEMRLGWLAKIRCFSVVRRHSLNLGVAQVSTGRQAQYGDFWDSAVDDRYRRLPRRRSKRSCIPRAARALVPVGCILPWSRGRMETESPSSRKLATLEARNARLERQTKFGPAGPMQNRS
jgi:hypothetical protein